MAEACAEGWFRFLEVWDPSWSCVLALGFGRCGKLRKYPNE